MIKKIKSKKGETITETLVSMMIAALAMMILAGSIVSAAKVNKKIKYLDTDFKVSEVAKTSTVSINHEGGQKTTIDVDVYVGNSKYKYTYYESK